MTPRVHIPNFENILQRYLDGESILSLAKESGLVDSTLKRRIKELGIPIRPGTSYPAHVDAAHAAARGRRHSAAERERMAISRQERGVGISHLEREFAEILDRRGISYTPQFALGPYNLDFAIGHGSVAVEVMGGGYNSIIRKNLPKRREYILDRGWHLIEIRCGRHGTGFSGADDYVVTFLDFARRNPASPRENRMIRRDGKPASFRGPYEYQAA